MMLHQCRSIVAGRVLTLPRRLVGSGQHAAAAASLWGGKGASAERVQEPTLASARGGRNSPWDRLPSAARCPPAPAPVPPTMLARARFRCLSTSRESTDRPDGNPAAGGSSERAQERMDAQTEVSAPVTHTPKARASAAGDQWFDDRFSPVSTPRMRARMRLRFRTCSIHSIACSVRASDCMHAQTRHNKLRPVHTRDVHARTDERVSNTVLVPAPRDVSSWHARTCRSATDI
jgi:hypothetical protein